MSPFTRGEENCVEQEQEHQRSRPERLAGGPYSTVFYFGGVDSSRKQEDWQLLYQCEADKGGSSNFAYSLRDQFVSESKVQSSIASTEKFKWHPMWPVRFLKKFN